MNIAQKKALAFIRKYRLSKKTLNRDTMRDIFKRQGFLLFWFIKDGRSSDEVENFLESRNLAGMIHGENCKDGFTYIRGRDRAVFVNDRLSEDNILHVLLHEQGHILHNHLAYQAQDGVQCEREADTFAVYVMHYINLKEKFRGLFLMGGVLLIAFYLVMLLVLLMR